MRRSSTIGLVAIAAIALVAAGCGGSKKKSAYSTSKTAYAAALDSICKAAKAKQNAITITSLQDLATKGPQEVAIFKAQLAQVKALGAPPAEIKSAVDDALAKGTSLLPLFDQFIAAAKAGDAAKVSAAEKKITALDKQTDPDFKAIGASSCLNASG